ncbi:hypothetical protein P5673_021734, partial [Acropora cervicornis]
SSPACCFIIPPRPKACAGSISVWERKLAFSRIKFRYDFLPRESLSSKEKADSSKMGKSSGAEQSHSSSPSMARNGRTEKVEGALNPCGNK